jgi:hypothetical protein
MFGTSKRKTEKEILVEKLIKKLMETNPNDWSCNEIYHQFSITVKHLGVSIFMGDDGISVYLDDSHVCLCSNTRYEYLEGALDLFVKICSNHETTLRRREAEKKAKEEEQKALNKLKRNLQ